MTSNDTAMIVMTLGFTITAIASAASLIVGLRNSRRTSKICEDVTTIEKNTNSMKDALVAATAKVSRAEGVAAGIEMAEESARNEGPIQVEIVKPIPPNGEKK